MYGFKEKAKYLRELNSTAHAEADISLLRRLSPQHKLNNVLNPSRKAEDILFALLDLTTSELIRTNRREFEKEKENENAEQSDATNQSGSDTGTDPLQSEQSGATPPDQPGTDSEKDTKAGDANDQPASDGSVEEQIRDIAFKNGLVLDLGLSNNQETVSVLSTDKLLVEDVEQPADEKKEVDPEEHEKMKAELEEVKEQLEELEGAAEELEEKTDELDSVTEELDETKEELEAVKEELEAEKKSQPKPSPKPKPTAKPKPAAKATPVKDQSKKKTSTQK